MYCVHCACTLAAEVEGKGLIIRFLSSANVQDDRAPSKAHIGEESGVFVIGHSPPCIVHPIYRVVNLFGRPHFQDKKEK